MDLEQPPQQDICAQCTTPMHQHYQHQSYAPEHFDCTQSVGTISTLTLRLDSRHAKDNEHLGAMAMALCYYIYSSAMLDTPSHSQPSSPMQHAPHICLDNVLSTVVEEKLQELSTLLHLDMLLISPTLWQQYKQLIGSAQQQQQQAITSLEHITMLWIRHILDTSTPHSGSKDAKIAIETLTLLLKIHEPMNFAQEFVVRMHALLRIKQASQRNH
jgi:hypothetical protein